MVPPSTKKLHEYFSKTFMIRALKDRFAIISEKEAIGIRTMASFEGSELIAVIRSNLKHLEKSQFRHVVNKLRKEFVNGRPTPRNSADD